MVNLLISYLLTQPSPTTAPLVTALQNSNLLTQLGGSDVTVNLVNTRDWEGNPPYVRLYDSGDVVPFQTFIAGAERIWIEKLYMHIEVAANGTAPGAADLNADYLRLAAEGAIQPLTKTIPANDLTLTDLGGSNSKDEIKKILILGAAPNRTPMGPGRDETDPKGTSKKTSRVELWVQHTRTIS